MPTLLDHLADYKLTFAEVKRQNAARQEVLNSPAYLELQARMEAMTAHIPDSRAELELDREALIKAMNAEGVTALEGCQVKTRKSREVDTMAVLRAFDGDLDAMMTVTTISQWKTSGYLRQTPARMTTLDRSASAMKTVADFVARQKQGEVLSYHEVQAAYGDLVVCYGLVGEELARAFKPKEAAYLGRKIAQAKAYKRGRYDEQLKLTAKDAEMQSLLEVGEEINAEIENAAIYEGLRILRESLDRAIDYCRSLASSLRKEESRS